MPRQIIEGVLGRNTPSYDMEVATKERSIAKKIPASRGNRTRSSRLKSNALTTEPKSQLSDTVVRDRVYI